MRDEPAAQGRSGWTRAARAHRDATPACACHDAPWFTGAACAGAQRRIPRTPLWPWPNPQRLRSEGARDRRFELSQANAFVAQWWCVRFVSARSRVRSSAWARLLLYLQGVGNFGDPSRPPRPPLGGRGRPAVRCCGARARAHTRSTRAHARARPPRGRRCWVGGGRAPAATPCTLLGAAPAAGARACRDAAGPRARASARPTRAPHWRAGCASGRAPTLGPMAAVDPPHVPRRGQDGAGRGARLEWSAGAPDAAVGAARACSQSSERARPPAARRQAARPRPPPAGAAARTSPHRSRARPHPPQRGALARMRAGGGAVPPRPHQERRRPPSPSSQD